MPPHAPYSKRIPSNQRRSKPLLIAAIFIIVGFLFSFSILPTGLIGAPLHALARPLWNGRFAAIHNVANFFTSKADLQSENQALEERIQELEMRLTDHRLLEEENREFKQQLGFGQAPGSADEGVQTLTPPVFARVLTKPPQTPYGSLIVDAGHPQGIEKGNIVLAPGRVAIGEVEMVYSQTATVRLYSAPETETAALLGVQEVPFSALGRGGGNFAIRAPRDSSVSVGDAVALAGEASIFLGSVNAVLSEPADPFKVAIFRTPVNIHELTRVEIVARSLKDETAALLSATSTMP